MNITVNGIIKEVNDCTNLEEFVTSSFEKNEGIIVELNEEIINRNHWKEQPLKDGDTIELLQLIGGG